MVRGLSFLTGVLGSYWDNGKKMEATILLYSIVQHSIV